MKDYDIKGLGGANFNKPLAGGINNAGKTSKIEGNFMQDGLKRLKHAEVANETNVGAKSYKMFDNPALQSAWETTILPNYAKVDKAPLNKSQENLTIDDKYYIPDRQYADEEV